MYDVVASPPAAPKLSSKLPATPLLAADVGGTHVRVGLLQAGQGANPDLQMLDYRQYRCADYPDLASILAAFRADRHHVRECAIASAGYALADGTVISANLPWSLSCDAIRTQLGLDAVHLVNDFEAVAHAAAYMQASTLLQLSGPAHAVNGPVLIVGPGTGLGAALWIPRGEQPVVLATEAGQASLAASSPLEIAVLQQMQQRHRHVTIEHALSGPGMVNLYTALCDVRHASATHCTPDAITAAGCTGEDALAVQTMQLFCGLLGSTLGDMALLYGAQGGIYLAGGILPQIRQLLENSNFVERFLNKGPMREALQHIPVRLIEHGQLGVIGAASWYLGRGGNSASASPHTVPQVHRDSRACTVSSEANPGYAAGIHQ